MAICGAMSSQGSQADWNRTRFSMADAVTLCPACAAGLSNDEKTLSAGAGRAGGGGRKPDGPGPWAVPGRR
ncbi:hypothetical protein AVXHC19_37280 [Acidovorax sacchari]